MRFIIASTLKPFIGDFIKEQTNAVLSWKHLKFPDHITKEIYIFGDDSGVAEFCQQHDIINRTHVYKNRKGVPMISDIIQQASGLADPEDFIMYINGDIILCQDFVDTVSAFIDQYRDIESCLLTSIRYDLFEYDFIDFNRPIVEQLQPEIKGKWSEPSAIDLFVFRKGNYNAMPDFAVSRLLFDTWMMDYAVSHFKMTVNMTPTVTIYHQYGKWYHDGKIIDRPDWNSNWWDKIDYVSARANIINAGNPTYKLVTDCSFVSVRNNGIKFVQTK